MIREWVQNQNSKEKVVNKPTLFLRMREPLILSRNYEAKETPKELGTKNGEILFSMKYNVKFIGTSHIILKKFTLLIIMKICGKPTIHV